MLNIMEVPDHVLMRILSFLKQIDLIYASRVNKKFNFFCTNDALQKNAADTSPDIPLLKYISNYVYNYRAVSRLPDKKIAIGCVSGRIQIWDCEKVSIINSISGYSDYQAYRQVLCVTYIGAEKILTAAYDDAFRIYQYRTGECLHVIPLPSSVKSMGLLTSEKVALGLYNGFIYILNLETLKFENIFRNSQSLVLGLTKLSESELVSCSQDGMIRIWNYYTGECISELQDIVNAKFNWAHHVINLGNDTLGSCHDDGFRVWNYKTGACIKSIIIKKRPFRKDIPAAMQTGERDAEVRCVVAHNLPNDKVLCRYGNGVMRVWNYNSGECLQVIHDHRKAILYTQQPSEFLDIPTDFPQKVQEGKDVNVRNIHTERHNYQFDEQGQMHLQLPQESPECLEEQTNRCALL